MNLFVSFESPFEMQLDFRKVFEYLEEEAAGSVCAKSTEARTLLEEAAAVPELRYGITDTKQIEANEDLIRRLLADFFPAALTLNEIKAINIPYANVIFNHSQRFKNILKAAGPDFHMQLMDFDAHQFYVFSCCLILNEYYGTELDFSRPLFYQIPSANGIIKYYRILYNADFLEINPIGKKPELTKEEIDLLLNNYDNLALWKEKFPPLTWKMSGFAIMTLYDATIENVVSTLKEKLLGVSAVGFKMNVESIFQSIYRNLAIHVGFTPYNEKEDKFGLDVFGKQLPSFILEEDRIATAQNLFCQKSYTSIIEKNTYFAVSDTKEFLQSYPESTIVQYLKSQKIRSCILAPLAKNGRLFGILEVVSDKPKLLNSINANKLEIVMPFLIDTVERLQSELQNKIQALIQNEYTTIHESVYWKFYEEAQRYIYHQKTGQKYELSEIMFPDVHPLYGQIDIKGSSETRNNSVQKDLQRQLTHLLMLLEKLCKNQILATIFESEITKIKNYLHAINFPIQAGTEHYISQYLDMAIHKKLREISDPEYIDLISEYFHHTDKHVGDFHIYRKKYENTIAMINEMMSMVLDDRQRQAQAIFPHYYERFKTDGVEHNLYIGASIAPKEDFEENDLFELRLWQLRTLCEMETAHHHLKAILPYPLDVTTLVLVYHAKIDIRFRMDEKRFDIDGSYNARYEIVKKRIDKAFIKGTNQRITQTGFLTIVYLNDHDQEIYIESILKTLATEGAIAAEWEKLDVEDLQGISGLRALRVAILHTEK